MMRKERARLYMTS